MPPEPESYSFTVTAETMDYIDPPPLPWWQRLWRKLTRQPMPQPIPVQPEGTMPMCVEIEDDGILRRYHFPAARITFPEHTDAD